MKNVKLVNLVKNNPRVPFSIATTLWYREGVTPFPGYAPLYP